MTRYWSEWSDGFPQRVSIRFCMLDDVNCDMWPLHRRRWFCACCYVALG